MSYLQKTFLLAAALLLAACAQPDGEQAAAGAASAGLDMSLAPNKVTSEDYRHEAVPVAEPSVTSVDADGNVAPFGMASRAPVEVAAVPVGAVAAVADASASAGDSSVYLAQCAACHGLDAQGVDGLGLNLTASQLVADSTADELVAFLKVGRMPDSPDSVSGIPMPGFGWMPDADLNQVVAYLKTL